MSQPARAIDPELHVLADGTRITVRPITPADKDGLRRAFERLGPRSRYNRFFSSRSALSDEMLRYLTEVDGHNHVALLAVIDSHDLKDEIGVGVARFVRLTDAPDVAEAAVTVIDEMQGKGIGRILLRSLSKAAKERGIRTFRGEVLASNTAMRRLLDDAGARLLPSDSEALTFDVPLGEETPAEDELSHRILRVVAEWVASFGPSALGDEDPSDPASR